MSATPTCPSEIPPYHRPVVRLPTERLTGNGEADLDVQVTYLDSVVPGTYEITLPNGQYPRQMHEFFIPNENVHRTASFIVVGNFVNFGALLLNGIGHSAVLEWDGHGWHVVGGNAGDTGAPFTVPPVAEEGQMWVRVKDGVLQLKSPDDMKWYDAFPRVAGGGVGLSMEGPGYDT